MPTHIPAHVLDELSSALGIDDFVISQMSSEVLRRHVEAGIVSLKDDPAARAALTQALLQMDSYL